MLTITHTPAEGTLIDGTARGDGTNAVLTPCGWRWSRTLGTWYVPRHPRHHPPDHDHRADHGPIPRRRHEVTVAIDTTQRRTAEVEVDRIARQEHRVAGLTARAQRVETKATAADDRAHTLARRVPFGQPVLVGHHSEGEMRRHYDQVDRAQRTAVELARATEDAVAAAHTAAHTTGARYNPVTVGNRIDKLEGEFCATTRAQDRATSDAYRDAVTARLAELTDQLDYWRGVQAAQFADGTATAHGPDTIRPGDRVKVRGTWYEVIRVNRKTITVPSGYSWTNTTPYREIQEHCPAKGGTATT